MKSFQKDYCRWDVTELSEAGHPKISHTLLFPSALPRLTREQKALCCQKEHHRLIFFRVI